MNFYDKISGLKLEIEGFETKEQSLQVSENFERKTTTIKLKGKEEEGLGEDVIYDVDSHVYPKLEDKLIGVYSFREISEKIRSLDLFSETVDNTDLQENYRRWGFESAALDLALRQNGKKFPEAIGEDYSPLRFLASPSMNETDIEKLKTLRKKVPGLEFKLDVKPDWDEEIISRLHELNAVKIVDFKSHYEGFGRKPDYELYSRVAEGFPDVILEDPVINEETLEAFAGYESNVTWDKPVKSLQSLKNLPFEVNYLNIKPSRFGSFESLFEIIEYCIENRITMYAGGQFELGVGRNQAQAIASIFYPDSPNDIAPRVFNSDEKENLPSSPLKPVIRRGFRWQFQ
jgi:hypothetical protein